jgi:hypothetical protein
MTTYKFLYFVDQPEEGDEIIINDHLFVFGKNMPLGATFQDTKGYFLHRLAVQLPEVEAVPVNDGIFFSGAEKVAERATSSRTWWYELVNQSAIGQESFAAGKKSVIENMVKAVEKFAGE